MFHAASCSKYHVIVIFASCRLLVIPRYQFSTCCRAFSVAGQSVRKFLPATSETLLLPVLSKESFGQNVLMHAVH